MIVDSISNKIGEFSCVAMPLSSLKALGRIISNNKAVGLLKHRLDLKNDMLMKNDWNDLAKTYVGSLLSNFFIIYFGQKPPT